MCRASGQTVCRTGRTITVDGIAVGAALDRDRRGRPSARLAGLPRRRGRRGLPDEPAVRDSLDGRYFGPLPATTIVGRADPLWIEEGSEHDATPAPRFDQSTAATTAFPFLLSGHSRCRRSLGPLGSRARALAGERSCIGAAMALLPATRALMPNPRATSGAASSHADPFAAFVAEAAQRFGIPASWIRAVMQAESGGDARAVSPKGAMGLMQIMPETWADLRPATASAPIPSIRTTTSWPAPRICGSCTIATAAPGFLAAYNAGPARYEDHLATGRPLPAETRAYVATARAADRRPARSTSAMVVDRRPFLDRGAAVHRARRQAIRRGDQPAAEQHADRHATDTGARI